MPEFHSVYHKFHMDSNGFESGPAQWEASDSSMPAIAWPLVVGDRLIMWIIFVVLFFVSFCKYVLLYVFISFSSEIFELCDLIRYFSQVL